MEHGIIHPHYKPYTCNCAPQPLEIHRKKLDQSLEVKNELFKLKMVTARIIIVQINHVRIYMTEEFIKQVIHELLIRLLLSHSSETVWNHDGTKITNKH